MSAIRKALAFIWAVITSSCCGWREDRKAGIEHDDDACWCNCHEGLVYR